MARILVIEDDHTLGRSLELTLRSSGHQVRWAQTLADARQGIEAGTDLLVLDLGLPDGDGLALCASLRETGQITPILVLSARSSLQDRVEGLTAGADDYLPKPFELPELLARVEALLRRTGWHGNEGSNTVRIGKLVLDFEAWEARVGERLVPLTELEFKLARYLYENAGRVVSREELLRKVWDLPGSTRTRTVDVFISRLRRHIEEDGSHPRHLFNVRGVGYRLVVPGTT